MASGEVQPDGSGLPYPDQMQQIYRDDHEPIIKDYIQQHVDVDHVQPINDEPLIDVECSQSNHTVSRDLNDVNQTQPIVNQPDRDIGLININHMGNGIGPSTSGYPGANQEQPISVQPTGMGTPEAGPTLPFEFEDYHSNWPNIYEDDQRPVMPRRPCGKTIVIQHPHNFRPIPKAPRQWSTGVSGCCKNPKMCAVFTFCCCCYDCWLAGELEETCCLPMVMTGPCATMALRIKLRNKYNIRGGVLTDCLCSMFCYPCTACQLGREIRHIQKHPELILNLI